MDLARALKAEDEIAPGTVITGFNHIIPQVDYAAQIAHSASLSLPEVLERKSLTVVANGPSAREIVPSALRGPTLALNGALRLFTEDGAWPTYWAACDPQPLVADFLINPPWRTKYLVASKCHASVFGALKGRDVRIWHVKDRPAQGKLRVALCCSVTLSALWLMRGLGYTDFDIWGWDGCFGEDGAHHAGSAETFEAAGIPPMFMNYGGKIEGDDVIGGRTYTTTRTWAAEADGASQFFQLADYFDLRVTIHGDGMMKAAQAAILAP